MICAFAEFVVAWTVIDVLRELHWERTHPKDEISPWRIRRLLREIEQLKQAGYSAFVITLDEYN